MPEDYTWRPLRADDAQRWESMIRGVAAWDRPTLESTAAEFAEVLGEIDLASDSLGVFRGEALVGYSLVRSGRGSGWYEIQGCVHGEHRGRGLGTRLLGWGRTRAARRCAAAGTAGELRVWCPEHNAAQKSLAERIGLRPTQWHLDVFSQLDQAPHIEAPELPEGFRVRVFEPGFDAKVREVHNRAFAGQEDGCFDADRWRREVTGKSGFLPELSFVVLDDRQAVVSYLLSFSLDDGDGEPACYLGYIGTPPETRGRGLCRALLAEHRGRARELGYTALCFSADESNPTKALDRFEHIGLWDPERDEVDRWVCYSGELPGDTTAPGMTEPPLESR
ncbi:GNAT family N-acetyltransferase [Saccharopolyspora erythraea]|uniref:GNAT family N-acetyltransferase n=1 Tax=Saccharopolyspora erythraea TaxID=1836 RepID=UPI0020117E16|nr:GNAT family N-acetyltransferase [Saccharopolyspora erythraea]